MTTDKSISSVSVTYARTGRTARSNELGMRPMQERAWEKRGEQYLLIKSPPASGKSRALMSIALDKLDSSSTVGRRNWHSARSRRDRMCRPSS